MPAATAVNSADRNSIRNERFDSVSLNSLSIGTKPLRARAGGCFRYGMCLCVPRLDT